MPVSSFAEKIHYAIFSKVVISVTLESYTAIVAQW
jgi:hypothetical protein